MKSFYIVSSLKNEQSYSAMSKRQKFSTQQEAEEHARSIIEQNKGSANEDLNFFVLKAVSIVGKPPAPVAVTPLE